MPHGAVGAIPGAYRRKPQTRSSTCVAELVRRSLHAARYGLGHTSGVAGCLASIPSIMLQCSAQLGNRATGRRARNS